MTRSTRIPSVLVAVLIAVSACGTSPPELPPDSPAKVVSVLTSDKGDDFLKKVTTYAWDDDGAAAAARFTWIGQDAGPAPQAMQAAAVLTGYLMANHGALTAVDSGFLGLSKVPAAQLNPLLMKSYASALAPHLGELVGGKQDAFDSLRTQTADDPLALRNLLSVFVADPESGRTIVEATHTAAEHYEEAAAAAPPGGDESVAHLAAAGSLLGAAYGAVELAGGDIPTPPIGEATNDVAVRIASILVPADPNAAKVSKYVQDGRLMSPADVESKFSNTAMRTYFLDLQDYISGKGFGRGMNAFHDAFMTRSGVPAP